MSRFILLLKRALWAACVLLVALYGLALAYALPRTQILRVSGADVVGSSLDSSDALSFIRAVDERGRSLVFRNEDTGWGFPPYFFKESSEVAADASRVALSDNPWVEVQYYGFRVPLLGAYPNIVGVEQSRRDAEPGVPVFNILFLAAHPILGGYAFWKLSRWRKRRALRAVAQAEQASASPEANASASSRPEAEPRQGSGASP